MIPVKVAACWAFDVDHTLEISGGPVKISQLVKLRERGDAVGICGNWFGFVGAVGGWHTLVCFIGPHYGVTKAQFLAQLKQFIPAEKFVMVGNDGDGVTSSADKAAAAEAGWEFVLEREFLEGL